MACALIAPDGELYLRPAMDTRTHIYTHECIHKQHTYMHATPHTCKSAHMDVQVHKNTHTYTYTCENTHTSHTCKMHPRVQTYMYVYTDTCTCKCANTKTHMWISICSTHIHMCIHTHTLAKNASIRTKHLCIHGCMYVCAHKHKHRRTREYFDAHISTCKHLYSYTQTCLDGYMYMCEHNHNHTGHKNWTLTCLPRLSAWIWPGAWH